jgi:hypothetical protein
VGWNSSILLFHHPMEINAPALFVVANGISFGTLALLAAMLLRMDKSDLRHELPMFYAYLVFSFLQSATLFPIRYYFGYLSGEYFIAYWLMNIVDTTLVFFFIHEVYAKALYRYEGLRSLCRMLFRWSIVVLVLVAVVTAMGSKAADRDAMYSSILILNRSAMIVELGLVALLFILAKSLSLGWRECIFGIAVGICFYCSMQLVAVSLRTHAQNAAAHLFAIVKPLIGVATLGIWTAYVYRSDRARVELMPFKNKNLEEWNAAVLQFLNH